MLVLAHAACQFDSGRMWQFLYAVVWAKTPTERFVCQLFTSFVQLEEFCEEISLANMVSRKVNSRNAGCALVAKNWNTLLNNY